MEIEKEPYKIVVFGVAGRGKSKFLNHLLLGPINGNINEPFVEFFDILKAKLPNPFHA